MTEGKRGLGRPEKRRLDGMDQDNKRTGEDRVQTGMNRKSFPGSLWPTCGCRADDDNDNDNDHNYIVNFK